MSNIGELRAFLNQDAAMGEFRKAIRGKISAELLVRAALTYAQKDGKVLRCSPQSVGKALMDCASLGLLPDGTLGTAYLVPYGDQCQLVIGYRGLIELARRSGALEQLDAHVVREGDVFEVEFGLTPKLRHVPDFTGAQGRQVVAAYAIANLTGGQRQIEVMGVSEIEAVRSRSRASKAGPWVTDYAEMCRKTAVRRLMKYLPLTPELAEAMDAADREYIQDAEIIEPADAPTNKTEALVRTLKHELVPDMREEVHAASGRLSDDDKAAIDAEEARLAAQADAEGEERFQRRQAAREATEKPRGKKGALIDNDDTSRMLG